MVLKNVLFKCAFSFDLKKKEVAAILFAKLQLFELILKFFI